jgi:hypothetical protein
MSDLFLNISDTMQKAIDNLKRLEHSVEDATLLTTDASECETLKLRKRKKKQMSPINSSSDEDLGEPPIISLCPTKKTAPPLNPITLPQHNLTVTPKHDKAPLPSLKNKSSSNLKNTKPTPYSIGTPSERNTQMGFSQQSCSSCVRKSSKSLIMSY